MYELGVARPLSNGRIFTGTEHLCDAHPTAITEMGLDMWSSGGVLAQCAGGPGVYLPYSKTTKLVKRQTLPQELSHEEAG